jgi:hypothetical protein
MLETKIISPYSATPTHHLIFDKYFALRNSNNITEILKKPGVVFGNSMYIYDGHHRTAIAREKKADIPAYIILSHENFLELPKEYVDSNLTPEKYTYEEVLKILENSSLADDEVFN